MNKHSGMFSSYGKFAKRVNQTFIVKNHMFNQGSTQPYVSDVNKRKILSKKN